MYEDVYLGQGEAVEQSIDGIFGGTGAVIDYPMCMAREISELSNLGQYRLSLQNMSYIVALHMTVMDIEAGKYLFGSAELFKS